MEELAAPVHKAPIICASPCNLLRTIPTQQEPSHAGQSLAAACRHWKQMHSWIATPQNRHCRISSRINLPGRCQQYAKFIRCPLVPCPASTPPVSQPTLELVASTTLQAPFDNAERSTPRPIHGRRCGLRCTVLLGAQAQLSCDRFPSFARFSCNSSTALSTSACVIGLSWDISCLCFSRRNSRRSSSTFAGSSAYAFS